MTGDDPLDDLTDKELGQLVRGTAAFRAAAACNEFATGARELRKNDQLAWKRLVRETHDHQSSSVTKRGTTAEIVDAFLSVVEEHAQLAEHPEDVAERAAGEFHTDGEEA